MNITTRARALALLVGATLAVALAGSTLAASPAPVQQDCMAEVELDFEATADSISVSWVDPCNNESGFQLLIADNADMTDATAWGAIGASDAPHFQEVGPFTFDDLDCGTTYHFQASAFRTSPASSSTTTVQSFATLACSSDNDSCPAAPAIAGDYLRESGMSPSDSQYSEIIQAVAQQTGANGDLWARYSCEEWYPAAVIDWIHEHFDLE